MPFPRSECASPRSNMSRRATKSAERISEAVPEIPKPKRGRPREFPNDIMDAHRALFPERRPRRGPMDTVNPGLATS